MPKRSAKYVQLCCSHCIFNIGVIAGKRNCKSLEKVKRELREIVKEAWKISRRKYIYRLSIGKGNKKLWYCLIPWCSIDKILRNRSKCHHSYNYFCLDLKKFLIKSMLDICYKCFWLLFCLTQIIKKSEPTFKIKIMI